MCTVVITSSVGCEGAGDSGAEEGPVLGAAWPLVAADSAWCCPAGSLCSSAMGLLLGVAAPPSVDLVAPGALCRKTCSVPLRKCMPTKCSVLTLKYERCGAHNAQHRCSAISQQ